MGNTCKSMAVSFQCMTKSTTSKIKIKIKKENHLFQASFTACAQQSHNMVMLHNKKGCSILIIIFLSLPPVVESF